MHLPGSSVNCVAYNIQMQRLKLAVQAGIHRDVQAASCNFHERSGWQNGTTQFLIPPCSVPRHGLC